ncbi:hypothetical protein [Mycolicibacterium fortuitum]|uniref:hypothetical protein n=1 Tax=Mycolicibacterium fortuitum TaxID=1766 RepID=UPI0007E9DBEC|nr:hypothetical protein [Mycolicibacterium fortuitum]OBG50182.1 hypothetical protein A5670_26430 [Mycolicibacterium fortuitum]
MTDLCEAADVVTRLGRDLTPTESGATPGLITEASVLVVGHLGRDWTELADVPVAVRTVASRMVARALVGASQLGNVPDGTVAYGSQLSVMSHQVRLGTDVAIGSPWLSRSDRITLSPYRFRGHVMNMPMFCRDE